MKCFVATSANMKTWDLNARNIIFAEPGCTANHEEEYNGNINYIEHEERWKDCKQFQDETDFLNTIENDILQRMTEAYSLTFGLSLTTRDIDRLLAPWLTYYIDAMYYKFFALEDIEKKYEDIYIYGLEEKDFFYADVPMDLMIRVGTDDIMNLQLFTCVAQYKGIRIEKYLNKDSIIVEENIAHDKRKINILRRPYKLFRYCIKKGIRVLKNIWCKCINIMSFQSKTVIINPTNFLMTRIELMGLMLHSKAEIGAFFTKQTKNRKNVYNKQFRRGFLFNKENPICDFERFLLERIVYDIPLNCMEGLYRSFGDIYAKRYKKVEKIVSDSGAECDYDAVKFILSKRKSCRWYNIELGGSGNFVSGRNEADLEERISDIYYTNGWIDKQKVCNYRPFYNPRFLHAATLGKNNIERHGVLYVGTFCARYRCLHDNAVSRNAKSYLESCLKLLEILSQAELDVTVRLYPDEGWGLEKRIADRFPNIKFDRLYEEFPKAVRKYELYVCDLLSTTWGEAYVSGTPIIIVGNRKLEHFSLAVEEWIEKLRSCGIYQENAHSAGRYIVSIIDHIEEWWNDVERQDIIQQFTDIYAHMPPSLEKNVWVKEIENISKE